MDSVIYLIVNLINNKYYIGSAEHYKTRWRNHRRELRGNVHHNPYLQSAWNKYGAENFGFSVLEECAIENLYIREQFWLDFTKCYEAHIGYNIRRTASSNKGLKHTPETLFKMSNTKRGKPKSEEHRRKIGETLKGRKHTEETKKKMSETSKGITQSKELVEKRTSKLIGRKHSEETKLKQSLIRSKYYKAKNASIIT